MHRKSILLIVLEKNLMLRKKLHMAWRSDLNAKFGTTFFARLLLHSTALQVGYRASALPRKYCLQFSTKKNTPEEWIGFA